MVTTIPLTYRGCAPTTAICTLNHSDTESRLVEHLTGKPVSANAAIREKHSQTVLAKMDVDLLPAAVCSARGAQYETKIVP